MNEQNVAMIYERTWGMCPPGARVKETRKEKEQRVVERSDPLCKFWTR